MNVAFLKSLPARAWRGYGVHEERGRESLGRMARLYAGHDLDDLRQIEELVAYRAPGRKGGRS